MARLRPCARTARREGTLSPLRKSCSLLDKSAPNVAQVLEGGNQPTASECDQKSLELGRPGPADPSPGAGLRAGGQLHRRPVLKRSHLMSFSSWMLNFLPSKHNRPTGRSRAASRFRPELEALEARVVPHA